MYLPDSRLRTAQTRPLTQKPQPSSEQSRSQPHSILSTLVVISSDEDTGNQSVASRTRSQRARQQTTSTAPLIENDTNDPPPTSQPTDDNPLTDLQDRQRAPLKQLSRCLENRTRIESPMSEISDEVFNGQKELNCSLEYISPQ